MKLTIYRRIFYNADCYQKGVKQVPKGIQVHSTGANNPYLHRYVSPDDGRIGANQYGNSHNRAGITTCASAYIGKQTDGTVAVYQALPWDYRCWLSGSGKNGNANRIGYIGFEVCEDNHQSESYFRDTMMIHAAALTAYLCTEYDIPLSRVRDHRELHDDGIASNHGDILSWSKAFGVTMDDFRDQVDAYMREGVEVEYIDCDDLPDEWATCSCTGKYLNIRATASVSSKSLGQIPKGATVGIVDSSDEVWWKVMYNGIIGYSMACYLTRNDTNCGDTADDECITVSVDKATAEAIIKALTEAMK